MSQAIKYFYIFTFVFLVFNLLFSVFTSNAFAANDCVELWGGVCQSTDIPCEGGQYHPGYCPGGTDIQCCVTAGVGLGQAGGLFQEATGKAGFAKAEQTPEVVIGGIIQGALVIIGTIFGVLMVYGGYLWMVARGNEEYVKKAKNILEAAVIGIIIVMGAYAISAYVVAKVIGAAQFGAQPP